MSKDSGIYVATESGVTEIDGAEISFSAGTTRVREGHALLKAVPHCFSPIEDGMDHAVERATARPGARRAAPAKAAATDDAAADKGDDKDGE